MAAVYLLYVCAVLNNEVQLDRCYQAPGNERAFSSERECLIARSDFAYTFGGVTPDKTRCQLDVNGKTVCPLAQWKTERSGPFNTTAQCMATDLPILRPVP